MEKISPPLFSCVLEGTPVPQGRPRVSRSGGVYYSKTSVEYRNDLLTVFRKFKPEQAIDQPVSVICGFAGMRKGADIDNVMKQILDALVTAEVITDDSWEIVRCIGAEWMDGEPRAEVAVWAW